MAKQEIDARNSIELTRLSDHYKRLNEKVEGIETDVKDIKKAILGNEFGDEGLAKKMKYLKDEIESLKDEQVKSNVRFDIFKWFVSVVGSAIIIILIKQIFEK